MPQRKKGGQPHNTNAAKPKGRLKIEISLADERRAKFERLAEDYHGREPTPDEIKTHARLILYQMIDGAPT